MSEISEESIKSAISQYQDPYLGTDLVSAKAVKDITITGDHVKLLIEPGFPCLGHHDELSGALTAIVENLDGVAAAEVEINTDIASMAVQKGVQTLPQVKNTIAIASGKGGVGKSTTAINLALALQAEGANVGILDADIYGPSQPRMLGCHNKPDSRDGKSVEPNVSYRLQSMSIGYLIDEETPMIWRGPMATSALEQLIRDTNWQDLDYLIIDLPPGTGDIQLTLSQKIPLSGAIIVTTPQDIALLD
ncbi:MAG: P-loop NTPase, partial [Gammaproteobacteria bacterium]|nr:P-loop NTPase [Gammaproteobacteria bacterium]